MTIRIKPSPRSIQTSNAQTPGSMLKFDNAHGTSQTWADEGKDRFTGGGGGGFFERHGGGGGGAFLFSATEVELGLRDATLP